MNATDRLQFGWGRRLPVVLQTEAAECGLACLAMIAGYHGHDSDPTALRRRFGFSLKGATLKDLIGVADRIGLASRPVRLELDELGMLRTPCILHWDLNHFVVLKSVGRGGIVIHDPAEGVRRLHASAEASRHFTGVALELTPTGGFEPAAAPPRVRHPRPARARHRPAARARPPADPRLRDRGLRAARPALPRADRRPGDRLGRPRPAPRRSPSPSACCSCCRPRSTALRGWMLITLGASLKVQARTNLFSHLLALPASYFEARHVADVMSRFDSQEDDPAGADHRPRRRDPRRADVRGDAGGDVPARPGARDRRARRRGALRAAALGLLRAAAAGLGRGDHLGGAARQPLPRDAARHQDHQALQRPARPPGALAEPAGRDGEPPARHPAARPAVPHRQRAAARRCSASWWSGWRRG